MKMQKRTKLAVIWYMVSTKLYLFYKHQKNSPRTFSSYPLVRLCVLGLWAPASCATYLWNYDTSAHTTIQSFHTAQSYFIKLSMRLLYQVKFSYRQFQAFSKILKMMDFIAKK